MFFKIESKLHDKQVAYMLTNASGQAVYAGIRPYKQLLNFEPHELSEELNLNIIDHNTDRLKLYNSFVIWCKDNNREHLIPQLRDLYKTWLLKAKLKAVVCIDTGETFDSAQTCARTHNLTYGALLKHLKGEKSFNTVKSRRYEYIAN